MVIFKLIYFFELMCVIKFSKFLIKNGILYVKQKVGCLPYDEDPQGFKSIHSQCLMKEVVNGWTLMVSEFFF